MHELRRTQLIINKQLKIVNFKLNNNVLESIVIWQTGNSEEGKALKTEMENLIEAQYQSVKNCCYFHTDNPVAEAIRKTVFQDFKEKGYSHQ